MPEEAQKRVDEITDVLGLAEELGKSISRINELFSFRRRINFVTRALAGAVIADILITAAIFFFFHALHDAQLQACNNTNEARASQVVVWNEVIHQFGPEHPSAVQVAKNKRFLLFIKNKFPKIDCSKL